MADQDYAHLILILDSSGSMGGRRLDGGIEGVNHLLKEQAKAERGYCTVTLVQFDTDYDEIYSFKPIHLVEMRNKQNWVPTGRTALYDAVGRTISADFKKINAMPEDKRPGVVIVNVTTDGIENASTEWTQAQVAALVREREADNWVVSYVSAGVDGTEQARGMGLDMGNFSNASPKAGGMIAAYAATSAQIGRSRDATSRGVLKEEKLAGGLAYSEAEVGAMLNGDEA
jgi:uncharacterized protein YegL